MFSVALLRAARPRPSGSLRVSWRYTGHASSQVFTLWTLPPRAEDGTPTAAGAPRPSRSAPARPRQRGSADIGYAPPPPGRVVLVRSGDRRPGSGGVVT